ncbi:MAG: hypothetical protein ABSE69_03150 [Roseiarcus sp.]|jgi:hypothetical protein
MMALRDWVRLPSAWIEAGGLRDLRWNRGEGADHITALMALLVIAHHGQELAVDDDKAELIATVTYDQLGSATGKSREKIAGGLDVLAAHKVITRAPRGRSTFRLEDYDHKRGWCKLPAKKLYSGESIEAFDAFNLRVIAELDAMKLYFLFAARRDNESNLANISYDTISAYSGVERGRLKKAISVLAAHGLVYVEHKKSSLNDYGVANAYRLAHLDSYAHMGTRGRRDADDFEIPTLPSAFVAGGQ